MEELEIFYNYYKHLHSYIDDFNYQYNHNGEKVTISAEMFKFVVDYYGFNGMPKKVSDKHFALIPKTKLYHGYKEFEHGANALVHFDYHYGMGYTHGIFLTDKKDYAMRFTRKGPSTPADKDKVLTCKINSDNFLTLKQVKALKYLNKNNMPEDCKYKDKLLKLCDFYDKLIERGEKKYASVFIGCMKNPSILSVYLGADFLLEEGTGHRIVFNRERIVASESEFNRFCENSEHYKDGCFDFYDREHPQNANITEQEVK